MSGEKAVKRDVMIVAIGELIAAAVMLGVFALLKKLDGKVLLAAAIGVALAVGNYALMAIGVNAASNAAEKGDAARAKRILNLSRLVRYVALAGIMLAVVLSDLFPLAGIIALVVPLVLFRPILSFGEAFRKGGEKTTE